MNLHVHRGSTGHRVSTFIVDFLARVVVTPTDARIVLEELSGVTEPPMIICMTTPSRRQQRYDHRLRDLIQTHRGSDHRHGSQYPALDGAWMAGCGADGRGHEGSESHGAGAPARRS